MALTLTRLLYIGTVLAAGIVIGLLVQQNPAWQEFALKPVIWPFGVSLVFDLFIGRLAAEGRAEPLTMMDRFIAVFGAGLIITLITAS